MAKEMFDDKAIPWIAASKSSDQKVDNLRAREREREEKGTTNSAP